MTLTPSYVNLGKNKSPFNGLVFSVAGALGIEPRSAVLETGVKPFNYTPKIHCMNILAVNH